MGLQKVSEIHRELIKTASKFLSPSLKAYFTRKANNDLEKLKSVGSAGTEKYISEQTELNNSLGRVVGIYNMYRDERTTL